MNRKMTIGLAAGAIALAGLAGAATLASAKYREGGWRGHHGHHGHHWRGHHSGKRLARLMERFDTDRDGKLTQDELNEARKALVAKYDADKDGRLSLQEYEPLWMEAVRRRMVRSFQRTDRDGDALVTEEEFLKPFSELVERFDRNGDGVLDKEDRKHWRHHDGDDDDGRRGRGRGGDRG